MVCGFLCKDRKCSGSFLNQSNKGVNNSLEKPYYLNSGLACYYDPRKRNWQKIKEIVLDKQYFKKIDSEPCVDTMEMKFFLLPGFIDAHCHLLMNPVIDGDFSSYLEAFDENDLLFQARNNALTAIKSGITSIRDLGGYDFHPIEITKRLRKELPIRLFTSGCYFTWAGGHCHNLGGIIVTSYEDFQENIMRLEAEEVLICKFLLGDESFTRDQLIPMMEFAKSRGMMVVSHAYTEKAAQLAVDSGTDTLEHAGDYSDNLIEDIKQKKIIIVPTYISAYDSNVENCEILSDVNSKVIIDWLEGERKVIPKLFGRGLRVGLGTDAGFPGTPCDSLIREITQIKAEFGISIEDLLFSAFVTTPETLNIDNLGRIEEGYFADFQCFYDNPLVDVEAKLGKPDEVWINGKRVDNDLKPSILLRRLSLCDVNSILPHLNVFDCGAVEDSWTRPELEDWILNTSDFCLGAFVDNELVGFCLTHFHKQVNKVYLENIFTIETYRRYGISRQLIAQVVNYYRKRSRKVRFIGLVNSRNDAAVNLFIKNSFHQGYQMYWMQRNIDDNS